MHLSMSESIAYLSLILVVFKFYRKKHFLNFRLNFHSIFKISRYNFTISKVWIIKYVLLSHSVSKIIFFAENSGVSTARQRNKCLRNEFFKICILFDRILQVMHLTDTLKLFANNCKEIQLFKHNYFLKKFKFEKWSFMLNYFN